MEGNVGEGMGEASCVAALRAELARLRAENDALREEVSRLESRLAGLVKELGSERAIVKRYNMERFSTKRDLESPSAAPSKPAGKKKPGRKPGSRASEPFAAALERLSRGNDPIVVDPAEGMGDEERSALRPLGSRESYQVEYVQPRIVVRKVVYKSYVGPGGRPVSAPSIAPIPGSPAGPGLLADAQFSKYALGVPAYRYARWSSAALGIKVSPQTATNWIVGASEAEAGVYGEILSSLASSGAAEAHVDESPVVMKLAGKRGFMFALSSDGGRPIRGYAFSETRSTEGVVDRLLDGFSGVLTVDGYRGYSRFAESLSIQRCMAHARRKFTDLAKVGDAEAAEVARLFDEVFECEREARARAGECGMLEARLSGGMPGAVERLRAKVEGIFEAAPENSPIRAAAKYFHNLGRQLFTFMEDGRASLDNNAAERAEKKLVMARRNFLFVNGVAGGEAAAISLTLIETALANGVEPRGYLKWVLENRLAAEKEPKDFLPWSPRLPDGLRLRKEGGK